MNLLRKIILDIKIYIKLNYIYKSKINYKQIRSILPNDVYLGSDVIVEENVSLGKNLKILSNGLYIGKNTYIGACDFIGKYTSISYDVKVGLVAHPTNYLSTSPLFYSKRRGLIENNIFNEIPNGCTKIGNDVLISANVTILAGVKIGDGAIIGAGAFVNKDIPPYSIAAGIPAKIIKYRFSEEIKNELLKSKWWDLPIDILLKKKDLFNNVPEFLNKIKY